MKKTGILILLMLFVGSLNAAFGQTTQPKPGSEQARIVAELNKTADGWNEGSLQKYLAVYIPEAKEMTREGPKGGVEHIEQTMRGGFWKSGKPEQVLRYESVEVRMLGKKNALVTGQFILSGNGKPDRKGWFTSVWEKTKSGWRMIHDHS